MSKWIIPVALAFAGFLAPSSASLEDLVRSVITLYLIIAGFLVLILQRRAWEFLRPLFLIGLALLFLPPLFHDLLVYAQRNLKSVLHYNVNIGPGWLLAPLAALAVFILFRFFVWYRGRPRVARQQVYRERERVMPQFDSDHEERG